MSGKRKPARPWEVEVWTEARDDGAVCWTIRINGKDHGGGIVSSHSEGHRDAANYLRDLEAKPSAS